jgi:hypothetical protein
MRITGKDSRSKVVKIFKRSPDWTLLMGDKVMGSGN